MIPISPKDLAEREFSKTLRGYNPSEVDEYINRIVENYSLLYRENVELAKQLSELLKKLDILTEERMLSKQTLQSAKLKADQVISDAYIRADDILASVKTSCDAIIRNFRDKADAQKKALTEIGHTLLTFKNELFEKYRLHIELIEQLSPSYENEEMLSADEYVERIVTELRREVAAQYGISLDNIEIPEPLKEKPAPPPEPEKKDEAPSETPKKSKPRKPRTTKKKTTKKQQPSVMELIEEYKDSSMLSESNAIPEEQFMLNFDEPSEKGVLSSNES